MSFRVGDEVVCVNDEWGPDAALLLAGLTPPAKGSIWTVTGSYVNPRWGEYVQLSGFGKVGLEPGHFRKLHPRGLSGWVEDLAAKRTDFEEPKRAPAPALTPGASHE